MSRSSSPDSAAESGPTSTVLRAENGDVIRADETGLLMRLSDRVLDDIADRLLARGFAPAGLDANAVSGSQGEDPEDYLPEGVDAWSVVREGGWTRFTANMGDKTGTRDYICKSRTDAIIADTPTPLLGILAIGGPRASLAAQRSSHFRHHIVAPGDDIGAVGMFGEEPAQPVDTLHLLREVTHEALVAEALLHDALSRHDALPLYFVRAETDGSTNASALADGLAYDNLEQAAGNLKRCAEALGKRSKLIGVFLDFALEDVLSTPIEYRDAMLGLMDKITRRFAAEGIPDPRFMSFFECGTQDLVDDATLEGQWELSWNNAGHNLVIVAPSYMLALDPEGRLPAQSLALRAAVSAEALTFDQSVGHWYCPTLHLAERDGDTIRVTAQCHGKLVLDADDPFGSGPHFGFSLEGVPDGVDIASVKIAEDDPKSVLITCSAPLTGPDAVLRYASGRPASIEGAYPANCGALRDDFVPRLNHDESAFDLALLRRWALPARLTVT